MSDNKDKFVVIYFFAEWCGPCKLLSPKVGALDESKEFGEGVAYAKVDVDENEEAAEEYDIEGKESSEGVLKVIKG